MKLALMQYKIWSAQELHTRRGLRIYSDGSFRFTKKGLAGLLGEQGIAGRIILLIVGIVTTCIAAALYYDADLSVSTYDAIPLHIADRKPKKYKKQQGGFTG